MQMYAASAVLHMQKKIMIKTFCLKTEKGIITTLDTRLLSEPNFTSLMKKLNLQKLDLPWKTKCQQHPVFPGGLPSKY